jgi:hypothetical protein
MVCAAALRTLRGVAYSQYGFWMTPGLDEGDAIDDVHVVAWRRQHMPSANMGAG